MKFVYIPWLDSRMKEAQASNEALAEASGVCMRSIAICRHTGRRMEESCALAVEQALNERTFAYKKRGPKGRKDGAY